MKAKVLFFLVLIGTGFLHLPQALSRQQSPEGFLEEAYNRAIENWWGPSLLLLRKGKAIGGEEGLRIMEFSKRLAPDLPSVHIETALYRWRLHPWELFVPFKGYLEGAQALLRNPPLLVKQVVEIFFYLSWAAVAATVGLGLVLIVKGLPLFFFQTDAKGQAVRLLLLGLPLVLRMSFPWILLLWGVFLWPHISRGGKVALLVALVGLTYLLPLPREFSQGLGEGPGKLLMDLYEMNYGTRGEGVWRRLRRRQGFDRDVYLSLAVGDKREGRYGEAERKLRAILLRRSTDADAWCDLGNVLLLQGRVEEAVKAYRKAINYRPEEGIYYYNLSKALVQQSIFFLPEASAAFKKATELAPRRIALQLQREAPHPNRSLLDATLRRREILWRALAELFRKEGAEFLWRPWLRGLSPRLPQGSPLAVLGLMALLAILRPSSSTRRCAMCGRLFSGLYSQREGEKTICLRCATVLKGRERDLPSREETVRQVKAFLRKEMRLLQVFQHLPGLAHLWQGHYLSGWTFLFLAVIALAGFLHPHGVLPHPYLVGSNLPAALPLWGLSFLLIYWAARGDALRRGHREVVRPPFYVGM